MNPIDPWSPLQGIALHCMLNTLHAQTRILSGSTWAQGAHSNNDDDKNKNNDNNNRDPFQLTIS